MKRLLLVLVLGITGTGVHAQTVFTSLKQLLDYADQNSELLRQGRIGEQNGVLEQDLLKSSLAPRVNFYSTAEFYPIIPSLVIPDIFNGGNGDKFRKVQFGMPLNFTNGIELSMPLVSFEKWESLKKAALHNQALQWKTQSDKEKLNISLTELYYKVLVTQQFMELNRENEKIVARLLELMEVRKKEEVINPADFNRAKNLWLDIQSISVEYQKAHDIYLNAVKSLLFLPGDVVLQIRDSLNGSIKMPQVLQTEQRPAVLYAHSMVRVAEQGIREIEKAALPRLSLSSRYYYQIGLKPGSNSQSVQFDASTIGLRLDVPLLAGGFYRTSREKARLQLRAAESVERQVQQSLTKEQNEWRIAWNAAIRKKDILEQKSKLAADNLRIAELSIREAVMEYDEFSSIFSEYIKTKIEAINNEGDVLLYQLLLTQYK